MKTGILSIFIVSLFHLSIYATHLPKHLLGYWLDSHTHEWCYGFFEDFAVYQNEFWHYESIQMKKNKGTIVLRKGDEQRTLKVKRLHGTDSLMSISPAGYKKKSFFRATRQPDYTLPDTKLFINNGIRPDSILIKGCLRQVDRPRIIAYTEYFTDKYGQEITIQTDSSGCFQQYIPVLNTSPLLLVFGDKEKYNIVAEPGDTLFVCYDGLSGETFFMGRNARVSQELHAFKKHCQHIPSYHFPYNQYQSVPLDQYFAQRCSTYQAAQRIQSDYLDLHPLVSARTKYYLYHQLPSEMLRDLLQQKYDLNRLEGEDFKPEHIAFIHQLWKEIPEIPTLYSSSFLTGIINDYCSYRLSPLPVWFSPNSLILLQELDKQQKVTLTPQQRKDFQDYQYGISLTISMQIKQWDSLRMERRLSPYKQAILRTDSLLKDTTTQRLLQKFQLQYPFLAERNELCRQISIVDTLPVPASIKEFFLCHYTYHKLLEHKKKPLYKESIALHDQYVTNEHLRRFVHHRQQFYQVLEGEKVAHAESIRRSDEYLHYQNGDSLLQAIIGPYRGKVIYMDIWGTWCGPCKENLKQVKPIKEHFKNKDVVFLYLACDSPQESWLNVIKEYQLTGEQSFHFNLPDAQQRRINQRLNVTGYPTYLLIDRNGKIVNGNAPSPQNPTFLIEEINKILH